jgi:hypothetical protein
MADMQPCHFVRVNPIGRTSENRRACCGTVVTLVWGCGFVETFISHLKF